MVVCYTIGDTDRTGMYGTLWRQFAYGTALPEIRGNSKTEAPRFRDVRVSSEAPEQNSAFLIRHSRNNTWSEF